jgi:multicomponent Na+:H+ antiporter subunit D
VSDWLPLLVAGPLAAAALITALHRVLSHSALDLFAGATAAAVAAGSAAAAVAARDGPLIVWIGGWIPREGEAIGIALAADGLGAGFACLIALLIVAVIAFARLYYGPTLQGLFHALLMIFLGGATGYCLTGDLFNLYVFFELIGVTAFVLTAFRMEEDALQGAMTFAVVNSLASIVLLAGIGVLYAAAGTVNLAELARAVPEADPGAVRLAFVLVIVGFLIKSAAVPFHFWLTDAYAGAAAPVCVLFGGASVSLGVFGAARLLWTAFGLEALPPGMVAALFWPLGLATALYAGLMALVEPNLKRVLALTTVAHVGVLLAALGALSAEALAGAAAYLAGHALAKAGLFVAAGLVILQTGSAAIDPPRRGAGFLAPAVLAAGGLMIADLPGSAISAGKAGITGALDAVWGGALAHGLTLASVISGAAIVLAALRLAFPAPGTEAPVPPDSRDNTTHLAIAALGAVLVAAGFAAAHPGFLGEVGRAAAHFARTADIAATTLDGAPFAPSPAAPPPAPSGFADLAPPAAALALAALLAWLNLLVRPVRRPAEAVLRLAARVHRLHTGNVGDYVAWAVAGLCAFGLATTVLGSLG